MHSSASHIFLETSEEKKQIINLISHSKTRNRTLQQQKKKGNRVWRYKKKNNKNDETLDCHIQGIDASSDFLERICSEYNWCLGQKSRQEGIRKEPVARHDECQAMK